jgi:tetratricopeptide (TPR) repeat protein
MMTEALKRHYTQYEGLAEQLWANGTKNWLSFSYILRGDFERASALLAGTMDYYREIDDRYFMTWALWLQALIAMHEGRPLDAIDLYRLQGDRSRDVDYLRGQVESYSGLGEASTAAGLYEEAAAALIDSLRISERMGMVTDMYAQITKLASAQAALGQAEEAVALLTMVIEDPVSVRQPLTVTHSIREVATDSLQHIRADMGDSEFEAATAHGGTLTFDSVVNDLLGRSSLADACGGR